MENRLVFILIILLAGGIVSAWEIEDVNGTWVADEDALKKSDVPSWEYSWGSGMSIPNYSTDIDLGRKEILLTGMGLYFIDTASKDEDSSVSLKLFSVEDEVRKNPLFMKVTFINSERVYIVCSPQKGWRSKPLSPESKWVWYRLSGPKGK